MSGESDGTSFGTAGDGTDTGAEPGYGGEPTSDPSGITTFGLEGLMSLSNPDIGYNVDNSVFSNDDSGLFGDIGYGVAPDLSTVLSGLNEDQGIFGKLGLPKALQSLVTVLAKQADKSGVLGKGLSTLGLAFNQNPGKAMGQQGMTTMAAMANPALGLGMQVAHALGLTDSITSAFGNTVGNGGQSVGSPTGGGEMDMSSILKGLGGIYSGYQGMKSAGDMLGGLQGLYSQNSPYAQQLRQQLARQDAASGRRSQYGPREVELQARLAQMASNQIPAMNQLSQRQNIMRAQMLQNGIGLFNSMGGLQGLRDLFSGGATQQWGGGLMNDLSNIFQADNGIGLYDMPPQVEIPIPDLGDWGQ